MLELKGRIDERGLRQCEGRTRARVEGRRSGIVRYRGGQRNPP